MMQRLFQTVGTQASQRLVAASAIAQRRCLHLHEVDSMDLLRSFDVSVGKGDRAFSSDEAVQVAKQMSTDKVVIKAQVLAGGRGKGHFDNGFQGGVHVVKGEDEIRSAADNMIGHRLITKQTDEHGRPCNMVQIAECMDIDKEFYFALLMDRSMGGPCIVGSSQGGMDIEAVAEATPDAIIKVPVDIKEGLSTDKAIQVAKDMGFADDIAPKAAQEMINLYTLFLEKDCTLVEINPLVQTKGGDVMCLDAKVNFDDNAGFRQKDVFEKRDVSQENAADVEAAKYDLNYIDLDGTIGCLVNGAGLAMATMDIIQLYGGRPANFLDVGGGATAEQVTAAFKLITSDPSVSAILVNIFGGIMRCDVIAEGIIEAASELHLNVPIVVRLQGTRKAEAKALIAESGLDIIAADDLDDAAQKACKSAHIVESAREAGLAVSIKCLKQKHLQDEEAMMTPRFT
ncbi:uncharacterized protein MONBRDRAFT_20070 [Monosiga brevicollis MX1]|uniref:Succinate--CoA ligase [ADP-forming] subunit beta, mitochondrial n=1 Tax=Monosiga brevicollis TaxID=81824 RepID=A9UTU9_MONBE|nr:uncharacterized protein MONBRDRAFT_20070 [Monosiga brevicollis MX1]EDQ91310.1 predicted protein [Monosiga brevicollis MX1]|eukprot:XP_001743732.1 hypothetical protein [Monosiga brevicollis MX1]